MEGWYWGQMFGEIRHGHCYFVKLSASPPQPPTPAQQDQLSTSSRIHWIYARTSASISDFPFIKLFCWLMNIHSKIKLMRCPSEIYKWQNIFVLLNQPAAKPNNIKVVLNTVPFTLSVLISWFTKMSLYHSLVPCTIFLPIPKCRPAVFGMTWKCRAHPFRVQD